MPHNSPVKEIFRIWVSMPLIQSTKEVLCQSVLATLGVDIAWNQYCPPLNTGFSLYLGHQSWRTPHTLVHLGIKLGKVTVTRSHYSTLLRHLSWGPPTLKSQLKISICPYRKPSWQYSLTVIPTYPILPWYLIPRGYPSFTTFNGQVSRVMWSNLDKSVPHGWP